MYKREVKGTGKKLVDCVMDEFLKNIHSKVSVDDMKKIKFDQNVTLSDYSRRSFVYSFFYTLRQRIDDPRGVKRSKN